ncbi:protein Flattop-like isoform X1 [Cyprinus carpio]|uniref:Protein Flattop n=1 Tax=Cyprinus carpio TaxID=7962 RepID=A0A9Q9ZPE7_CYPCA|nr:protein Flattop-like isoform X1 [Cyprinus carpio]
MPVTLNLQMQKHARQSNRAQRSVQTLQMFTFFKKKGKRPSAAEGHTTFIATDRGHLLSGVRTKRGSAWPAFQGTWDLPRCIPTASINPTARSQEGQDRLRTWRQMKLSPNQTHEAPAGSQATNRTVNNVENINVDQPAEESKMTVNDPDQNEPERPKSQYSQDQSRPASQQAQSNPVNQTQSRPGSQAPSRPVTQESQAELRPPTQNSRPASQQK